MDESEAISDARWQAFKILLDILVTEKVLESSQAMQIVKRLMARAESAQSASDWLKENGHEDNAEAHRILREKTSGVAREIDEWLDQLFASMSKNPKTLREIFFKK